MTPDQFDLATHSTWLTLWLITDFPGARSHAVSGASGGTFHLRGVRGWFDTTGRGITWSSRLGTEPDVAVTWAEISHWANALPADTKKRAARLQKTSREIQRTYPSHYPGIGRPYCWDARDDRHTGDDCPQCATDRDDLAAANARRDTERHEWWQRDREHDAEVRDFIASLRPADEPADLLELLEAM